jgi:ribokinase
MKVLSFGSINVDCVYHLDDFVKRGETLPCKRLEKLLGGKGANQSIAVALAGGKVMHAGKVSSDDQWLIDDMKGYGVDASLVKTEDGPSGHAIIQMDNTGDNSIITFGGTNQTIDEAQIEEAFSHAEDGDLLLIQNELNVTGRLIEEGHKRGMKMFMNTSPINEAILGYPLDLIDYVIANEVEAEALSGEADVEKVLDAMRPRFPNSTIVVTLGRDGAICLDSSNEKYVIPVPDVPRVATTSAGDTFMGYFLASIAQDKSVKDALELACKASSLCVTRPGTTNSIPCAQDVADWDPEECMAATNL